ncbi:MAG: hypothetical protein ABJG68_07405 [Crocinitomicaceae bacterium]
MKIENNKPNLNDQLHKLEMLLLKVKSEIDSTTEANGSKLKSKM